ncbi:MAG TPA: hypothetical protein VD704_05465 [Gaiellaceae bacterium]|nr:hypothetical protein [Gaiellaceae bacterium]
MKTALAALLILAVGVGLGITGTLFLADRSTGSEGGGTLEAAEDGNGGAGVPGSGCDYRDTSGCVPGAEIVLTDGEWTCDQPLEAYAEQLGGTLPLKVTARFTTYVETVAGIVDLTSGCRGDGTDAIDLILDIQGDGRTVGGTGDALTVKIEATDIDITGTIDCGPRGPGAHQDGIQALGASDIAFVDLEVGDWDDRRATCTGASAGIDISLGGAAALVPSDYRCIRCRVVACRRAINVGESRNVRVTDGRFRSGNESERNEELATGEVGLCNFGVSPCNVDPTAEGVVFERNVCDKHPYEGTRRR